MIQRKSGGNIYVKITNGLFEKSKTSNYSKIREIFVHIQNTDHPSTFLK
jgi:hypothetical protein